MDITSMWILHRKSSAPVGDVELPQVLESRAQAVAIALDPVNTGQRVWVECAATGCRVFVSPEEHKFSMAELEKAERLPRCKRDRINSQLNNVESLLERTPREGRITLTMLCRLGKISYATITSPRNQVLKVRALSILEAHNHGVAVRDRRFAPQTKVLSKRERTKQHVLAVLDKLVSQELGRRLLIKDLCADAGIARSMLSNIIYADLYQEVKARILAYNTAHGFGASMQEYMRMEADRRLKDVLAEIEKNTINVKISLNRIFDLAGVCMSSFDRSGDAEMHRRLKDAVKTHNERLVERKVLSALSNVQAQNPTGSINLKMVMLEANLDADHLRRSRLSMLEARVKEKLIEHNLQAVVAGGAGIHNRVPVARCTDIDPSKLQNEPQRLAYAAVQKLALLPEKMTMKTVTRLAGIGSTTFYRDSHAEFFAWLKTKMLQHNTSVVCPA